MADNPKITKCPIDPMLLYSTQLNGNTKSRQLLEAKDCIELAQHFARPMNQADSPNKNKTWLMQPTKYQRRALMKIGLWKEGLTRRKAQSIIYGNQRKLKFDNPSYRLAVLKNLYKQRKKQKETI